MTCMTACDCMTHICFWLVCSGHYFCWVYRGLQGMNTSSTLCSWAMPVLALASRSVRKQPFAKPMLKALRPINMCLAKMEQKNFSLWESFRMVFLSSLKKQYNTRLRSPTIQIDRNEICFTPHGIDIRNLSPVFVSPLFRSYFSEFRVVS